MGEIDRIDSSRSGIEQWLTGRVAEIARRPGARIGPDEQLTDFGVDSVGALTLCSAIEDKYDLDVDLGVLWSAPTVRALSEVVSERLRPPG